MSKRQSHMWTKKEIRTLFDMWEGSTKQEMSDKIGVDITKIGYMANLLRRAGAKLSKKNKKGYLMNLIKEVLSEVQ